MIKIPSIKAIRLMVLAMSVIYITGCEKEDLNAVEQSLDPIEAAPGQAGGDHDVIHTSRDKVLDNVAKRLARSLEKEEVRAFIKSEALKKFDGDFDILYSAVKDKSITGSKFSEHLNQAAKAGEDVNQFAARVPLLNIAVPVNIDKWNTQNFTPLVAIAHSSLDEKTTKLVKAYDSKGNIHWLDAQQAPDYPVVVVGLNERIEVDKNGNLLKVNKFPSVNSRMEDQSMEEIDDGGSGGGGSTGGSTGSTTDCRVDKRYEWLTGMEFADVSYYEAWARGAPEVRLIVKSPKHNFDGPNDQTGISIGDFKPSNRSDVNGKRWGLNSDLFPWDKDLNGLTIGFYFYEIDEGGSGQTINLSLTYKLPGGGTATAKTDLKIGSSDDHIGLKTVNFDTCLPGGYSLGGGVAKFTFWLSNK
jgi:hypothetical protein